MLRNEPHVIVLVLVRDGDVTPIGNEIDDIGHPKLVSLDGEGQVENAINVVVEHPHERLVVFRVDGLEVVVIYWLAEHVLVDG